MDIDFRLRDQWSIPHQRPSSNDAPRVVVIGSGPTGAIAAYTLVQGGIPVTLLESGLRPPTGMLVRAAGQTVLRLRCDRAVIDHRVPGATLAPLWYQLFAPGGLSNLWSGAVPRYCPEDFSDGAKLDECYRWPVTYDDLVPYYRRIERILRVRGSPVDVPQQPHGEITRASELVGAWQTVAQHALTHEQGLIPVPLANGSDWAVYRRTSAFDSYTGIIQRLRRNTLFQLYLGSHALCLKWSSQKRRVTGVVFADRITGSQHYLPAAAVVIAAGALQSTKLLFDSACSDFPYGFGNTEGILGKYLHDHVHDYVLLHTARVLPRLHHPLNLTRSPYYSSAPLLATLSTIGNSRQSLLRRVLDLTPAPSHTFTAITFGTTIPTLDRCVYPSSTMKDEFGLPTLEIQMAFSQQEIANIHQARERILAIFGDAGFQPSIQAALDQHIPGSSVHYGGTVRMHISSKDGMLDAWHRLHAVPNVLVVDSSAFTTSVEKNPTLTAMALAARAAEHLVIQLKESL